MCSYFWGHSLCVLFGVAFSWRLISISVNETIYNGCASDFSHCVFVCLCVWHISIAYTDRHTHTPIDRQSCNVYWYHGWTNVWMRKRYTTRWQSWGSSSCARMCEWRVSALKRVVFIVWQRECQRKLSSLMNAVVDRWRNEMNFEKLK